MSLIVAIYLLSDEKEKQKLLEEDRQYLRQPVGAGLGFAYLGP